jgi:hypothetical protein
MEYSLDIELILVRWMGLSRRTEPSEEGSREGHPAKSNPGEGRPFAGRREWL